MNNSDVNIDSTHPLVSIAVITYNQKDFLKECIESILIQDYENIEIVIADDCSNDGTQFMLQEYQLKFPGKFVLVLSEKNLGITKNSNRAHFACSGKYIFWMGGDDLMLPGKIFKQVSYMENNPSCSICYHNLEVFESTTNTTLFLLNNSHNSFTGDFKKVVSKGVFNGACSTVVRSEKSPKKGFDERIPIASDWLYWMQTLLNGGEIKYIDEVLGRYRRHNNNVTNNLLKFNGQIDHLNSCTIMLLEVPQYSREILKRYYEILRSLRIYDPKNYYSWLLASLNVSINLKTLFLLLVYCISFGKIKK
jgi:glycosyltransferase involved in cell wall biosynthesis